MSASPVVLFDWDGTLVDTRAALLAAWHQVTEAHLGRRFPVSAQEQSWAFSRRGVETFPQLSDDPAVVEAMIAGFTPAYREHAAEVTPFGGVPELLAGLRAAGRRIGVITSKAADRFALDAGTTGLGQDWDVVVCGDDVRRGKPDPEAVLVALRRLSAPAEAAVVVGDSPSDMAAARAAGARPVGVAWGFTEPAELSAAGASVVVPDRPALLAHCLSDTA